MDVDDKYVEKLKVLLEEANDYNSEKLSKLWGFFCIECKNSWFEVNKLEKYQIEILQYAQKNCYPVSSKYVENMAVGSKFYWQEYGTEPGKLDLEEYCYKLYM